jgi:prevent-host-death family protein
MTQIAASQLRDRMSDTLNRVAYMGERITIHRQGKRVAVLIPIDDAAFLEQLEDRLDLEEARKALKETGSIAWETVKERLGL